VAAQKERKTISIGRKFIILLEVDKHGDSFFFSEMTWIKVKLSHYCHVGTKWGRKYSSCSFLTLALDGFERSESCPGHSLPLRKDPHYPLIRRLGGPHRWSGQRLEKITLASARDRTPVIQSVVRHYAD
jgi:hypothetical protein